VLKAQPKRSTAHLVTINANRDGNYGIPSLGSELLTRACPVGEQERVELDGRLGGVGVIPQRGVYAILAGLLANIFQGSLVCFLFDLLFADEFREKVLPAWESRVVARGCAVVVLDVVGDYIFKTADGGVFQLLQVFAEAVIEFYAADEVLRLVFCPGIPEL
jgi:hypothetical protein